MPWLSTVKTFKVLLNFLLKILPLTLSLFKGSVILPVHDVGISPFLLFKVAVFPRVLLLSSAKIIVQTAGHTNQVFLNIRELLNGHRVFNLYA
jgi:hypothetical protein